MKPKEIENVSNAPKTTSSIHHLTMHTSRESHHEKSSPTLSLHRTRSLLDSTRRTETAASHPDHSLSVIPKMPMTDRDSQIIQNGSLSRTITTHLASRVNNTPVRPDNLPHFAKRSSKNSALTLDQLLRGVELKRARKTGSNQRDLFLSLKTKPVNIPKFGLQTFYQNKKEQSPRRVATEPVEVVETFSRFDERENRYEPKLRASEIEIPKIRRNNSESGGHKYCKVKPSILDLLTSDRDREIGSPEPERKIALDKSLSKIKFSKNKSKVDSEQFKIQTHRNEKSLQLLQSKFAKRRAGGDLLTSINYFADKQKSEIQPNEEKHRFTYQDMDDEDGRDAEDRAADALVLKLAKYPFDRTLLRLNRQATIECYLEDKKRKSSPTQPRKNFERIRRKLKEVLITMKRLKLTMREVKLLDFELKKKI